MKQKQEKIDTKPVTEDNLIGKTEKKYWYLKLKERWGVSSDFQVFLIFLVFGLTGSTAVRVGGHLFQWIGLSAIQPGWLKTTVYLIFIFPLYQVLLLLYAFVLGQFAFFWQKMKKMRRMMQKLLGEKKS